MDPKISMNINKLIISSGNDDIKIYEEDYE